MGRGAIATITGLCTAPLFGTLGFWLADLALGSGGGSDTSIANAYMALLIGILAAIGSGTLASIAVALWLPPRFRRHALIGNIVVVIAMIAGWQIFIAEPGPLEYADARPSLEAEIRVPKAAGGATAIVAIAFIDDLLDTRHDDQIRTEGDFEILPWDTTPYRVKAWAIQIAMRDHQPWTRFDLDLPVRPIQSTDWSPWLAPVQGDGLDMPKDVTLRYRFRLIPHGQ